MSAVFISLQLVLLPLTLPTQPTCGVQPIVETAVEAPVLAAFAGRIDAYMQLHNEVERSLGPRQLFDDPEDLFADLEARRSEIRRARPDARRGDLFTDDVAALIRTRLEARLAACNQKVEDVLAFVNEERLPGAPEPSINQRFPWELGSAMWPSLLAALPPLPDGVEYRFADRALVLIDIHCSIVVDILLNALPAPTHADHGAHSG